MEIVTVFKANAINITLKYALGRFIKTNCEQKLKFRKGIIMVPHIVQPFNLDKAWERRFLINITCLVKCDVNKIHSFIKLLRRLS